MNLLIVDDELIIRQGLMGLNWSEIGITQVLSASNGLEAKELLLRESIDLAIFDIRMPGLSGLELAEFIKEYSLDIGVILLTGYSDFSYAQRALHSGVARYVLKPFHPREILKVVDSVKKELEQKRYQRQVVRKYEEKVGASDTLSQVKNYFPEVSSLVADVLRDIAKEFTDAVSLEELAGRYHFSETYLSRRIRRETGYSFSDILKAIRLMNAAMLLIEGKKVNQACFAAGFRDQRYFSQVFRNVFHCSPSDLKKQEKKDIRFHSVLKRVAERKDCREHEE